MASAKRHYPPSYYRYRERHPSISVRLSKELKEALDAYRGGLSYGRAIKRLLSEKASLIKGEAEAEMARMQAFKRGYDEGYNRAMRMERFTVPCTVCGKPMLFLSEHSNWESDVKPALHRAFSSWRHHRCKK